VPRTLLWQQGLNETTAVKNTGTSGRGLDARTTDILLLLLPELIANV